MDPVAVRAGEMGHFLFYDARSGEALWKVPPSERVRLRREGLRRVLLDGVDVQVRIMPFDPTGFCIHEVIGPFKTPHFFYSDSLLSLHASCYDVERFQIS